jgi:hypothetical protein
MAENIAVEFATFSCFANDRAKTRDKKNLQIRDTLHGVSSCSNKACRVWFWMKKLGQGVGLFALISSNRVVWMPQY